MKSVIVQGATIAKAIDEALQKAGMPQEFFVKILEEAQPGFLGFGSKKAKIALFFKKIDTRRNNSLIQGGAYQELFNNQGLQAQADVQDKAENKVEKKIIVEPISNASEQQPRQQQPRPQQARPPQQPPRERRPEIKQPELKQRPVQQKKVQQEPVVKPQQPIAQEKVVNQAPTQAPVAKPVVHPRPIQHKVNMQQRKIADVAQPKKDIVPNESLPVEDASAQVPPQNRRPRRRRSYGYRSRGPIQWGKSSDEAHADTDVKINQNTTNEPPKDSESK